MQIACQFCGVDAGVLCENAHEASKCGITENFRRMFHWNDGEKLLYEIFRHFQTLDARRKAMAKATKPPDLSWIDALNPIYLSLQELDDLPEYSASIPTGTTPGKKWKRHVGSYDPRCKSPRWIVNQYDPNCPTDSKTIDIHSYRPVIRVKAKGVRV